MNICVLKAECPNQFKIDKEDLNMVSYQEGYADAIDECIKAIEDTKSLFDLRHDRNITEEEYQEIISKLDGHDKQIRADAFDEFISTILPRMKWGNDVYTLAIEHCIEVAEQLKEQK